MLAKEITSESKEVSKLRNRAGLSQEQLAYLIGTSWGTVSRLERGKVKNPSEDTLERLSRIKKLLQVIGGILGKNPKKLIRFLQTPQDGLRGYRPYDLLNNAFSFEALLDFIEGSKAGEMS